MYTLNDIVQKVLYIVGLIGVFDKNSVIAYISLVVEPANISVFIFTRSKLSSILY